MEAEFLAWLKNTLPQGDRFLVGLGDDAAVLDWQSQPNCVVTSDLLADGTHFRLEEHSPEQIGRKLAAVNLSDLAAMGAKPSGLLISLLLPHSFPTELVKRLYAGMLPLCERFDVAIAGGDTNVWDGKLVVSATAFGVCTQRPFTRSGAAAGDSVLVTGTLGGSLAGHHIDFVPRVQESLILARDYRVTAAMDVSDRLALDASRIALASDCGIALDLSAVPCSEAAIRLSGNAPERSALQRALSDGEDFELLFTMPPSEAERLLAEEPFDVRVTAIGTVVAERGLWQATLGGQLESLPAAGFLHGDE